MTYSSEVKFFQTTTRRVTVGYFEVSKGAVGINIKTELIRDTCRRHMREAMVDTGSESFFSCNDKYVLLMLEFLKGFLDYRYEE